LNERSEKHIVYQGLAAGQRGRIGDDRDGPCLRSNGRCRPAGAAKADAVDEVIVIGTRRTDRTVADSASPIDVVSAAELAAQPSGNMLDTLNNIIPSFFVGQNTISDASTFVRAPSLRGLPADQVLVMLNGKRYNRSALVQVYNGGDTGLSFGSQGADISAIPSIAIKSLEVLRDGATAQYGSDAIAGVLNYGLRDDMGFEMQARYGQYQTDSDGKSYQIAAAGGLKLGETGFVRVSGEYNNDGQTSRGETRPIAAAFAAENPTLASKLPHYPLPAQIWGNSPSEGYKFVVNSGFESPIRPRSTPSPTSPTAMRTRASTSAHRWWGRGPSRPRTDRPSALAAGPSSSSPTI